MAKKISPNDVKHLAQLAKLKLSAEEIARFAPQLEEIVQFFEQLQEVDTKHVLETSQTTGLENVWREDAITRCPYEKELIACSAHPIEKNQIRIPSVLS
jgi:aspartyl-tRNA(Asn)/glutamyl-tRNA(Gln) amidotransferase subunit C